MHFAAVWSRVLFAVPALALAAGTGAKPPEPPPPTLDGVPDAVLAAIAKPTIFGDIVTTARARLPSGEDAFLVASRHQRRGGPVHVFKLIVFAAEAAGPTMVTHEEVRVGPFFGAPVVGLAAGAQPVAEGEIGVIVGWKAPDASSEEQLFVYRFSGGRLQRLMEVKPNRTFAPASGRPSERHDVELLPTSTSTLRDVRILTRECPPGGECGDPLEVASYTYDGVRYVQRPYAIPFVEKIEASSELASAGALADYSAGSAVDGRLDTAWCEGAAGPGWFQKLELTFSPAQRVKAISILPGPPKGETFADWTRPKRVRVLLPDGRKAEANLADAPRTQRVELPEGDRVFGLTVVILDVVKGKREDACIAELELEVEP